MADPTNQNEGEMVGIEVADADVIENEDGSAIIRLANDAQNADALAHFANIVAEVDPQELKTVVNDLLDKIEKDKEARSKRDKLYEEGLRRTGLADDAPGGAKFSGANRVVHPMLIEACVDFSARVMKEVFPPSGPVKSRVFGIVDQDKSTKADRKSAYMNWQTTEQMQEFRGEIEQLTTQLPLGGAQYLKLCWSNGKRRAISEFVAIDDVLLPYAATNFYSAERKTHVQYITKAEYNKRVKAGMYADVDLPQPDNIDQTAAAKANDKIEGKTVDAYNQDGLRTVFEVYTDIDFGDGVAPYILTIDKSSGIALALYRNWQPDDTQKTELEWMVEFPFIPWRGAYPIGLTHLIGSLAGAATGSLRALLDSAHIQNIPTLLKLKGGSSGQTITVQPTEVCEIEGGAMVDDIRKLVMQMPFAGPSPTLFNLLGFLVDAGRGVVQTSFEKLSDANQAQPVGTTLALIEQGMVVFSSIHSRLHSSMSRVFKILHRINGSYLTEADIESQGSGLDARPDDFDGPMDVVPVSDPAIFSETQRFAQVTALQQRAAAMPQLYDQRKVEELFLRALKIDDSVLVPKVGEDDIDPVSENVAASMGRPVYVLPKQDHIAHIKTHVGFLTSPLFGANPVIARTFAIPMVTHLRDHLLNYYMAEARNAVNVAEQNQLIGDDAEQQARIILLAQAEMERFMGNFAQVLQAEAQKAQQYVQQPAPPPDSRLQVAQMTLQAKAQSEQAKLQADQQKVAVQAQADQQKTAIEAQADQADLQFKAQKQAQDLAMEERKLQADFVLQQMAEQAEDARKAADLASEERINAQDNQTAMQIAAVEVVSGNKVALSTGGGINPGN